ncbi:class I SAM-dependent methyltransferase [Flexivirga caeni]|nr:class I SAM-dependent methyltransferase [Flexivirga caeni]
MADERRHPHVTGNGSGAITADGCPVELWAALPPGEIPALLSSALPPGCTVLDLGAGAGRLTHPLVRAGHHVTAVDESAEMLGHVHGATAVLSTIEELRLDETFDVVLLASHLVNVPDTAARQRLLATCRHHVAGDGAVILQRFTPEWTQTATGRSDLGAGITCDTSLGPGPDPGLVSAVATYIFGDRRWQQSYVTCPLSDHQLTADLHEAGLRLDRWLSDDGRWVIVVPDS